MTRWGRWLRLGTLLAAAAGLWSCVAPILTVPPPGAITFTPALVMDASGKARTVWITQGGPLEQASRAAYYVVNRRLGTGVIATAQIDGSFMAPAMDGEMNDQILISYRTPAGDDSDSTCLLLSSDPVPASCL